MAKKKLKYKRPIIVVLFIISCFLLVEMMTSIYTLIQLKSNIAQIEIKKEEIKKQNELLSSEIDKLNDPEYVARYAKSHYMFTEEGEVIIILPKKEEGEE